ncbi:MAG: UDP-N-acetylmuramoyl-L-alanyl-D-glutamate--2,6-diaminopimelate ligase [Planctomycetota bacterium]
MSWDLDALVQGIVPEAPGRRLAPSLPVSGLARDSRAVRPGELFVAVPGTRHDGAAYARDAAARGACAVVAERALPELSLHGVPVLVVPHAARALGLLADRFWGEPSREVGVVGVTGTNGKTTTTFLTQALLARSGRPTALLGTVCTRVAGQQRVAKQTTPCVLETQAALAAARAAGERHLVMEVSSHALDQERVAGVRFRVGVFTNLTRDHLDYHGTLEAYGAAKARLFEALERGGVAVLNARDPFSARIAASTRAEVLRYAWVPAREPWPAIEVAARVESEDAQGTAVRLRLYGRELTLVVARRLPLLGRFNVENALAAAGAALALGVPPDEVAGALSDCPSVPGRLERVAGPAPGPTVLVDYAHTPDALERVLSALRPLTPGRLWVVFGCGGERDRGKRGPMGLAALRHADHAILTSDNPRSEDPAAIVEDVLSGCPRQALEQGALEVELDREAAIVRAVRAAGPGDVVVLAGKGHETVQEIGGRALPFDDREVARLALTLARAS